MSSIEKLDGFRIPIALGTSHEGLIEAAGTKAFGLAVRQAVNTHTRGARRLYLYRAKSRNESCLEYHACEAGVTALFPLYRARYHRLDPVCDAYGAATRVGEIVMQRVRPSDIECSEFRRRFFDDAGIVERVSVVQRGREEWRAMNLARHKKDGYFTDTELTNIVGLAGLALPMLALNRSHAEGVASVTVAALETRFEMLSVRLSPRERQVCARAVIGLSVEATGLDLEIGKASVLTYRRRAYERLGVNSPFELCALVAF
jgi:DNA-binding CsgD family transcriptional regulator